MKGYKVFDPNMQCRGFQFEVGKTYEQKGNLKICNNGFRFCEKLVDCYEYYNFNSDNKVAEIEALGEIDTDGNKSCTNKIKIVKEISWSEVLELVNMGKGNTGRKNTGDSNTGNSNTGNSNTGYRNTGDSNTGNSNTGDRNTGDSNTGYRNTGDSNTGDRNTGYSNTGDNNKTNNCTGVFCTEVQKIKIFDIETDMTIDEWRNSKASEVIRCNFESSAWIYSCNMTDEEKKSNPQHETCDGYLKTFTPEESWSNLWKSITKSEKQEIMNIPNFNKDKFKFITGIEV